MIHLEEERKIYMRTIQFLDESTDDYLYLYDLINKKLYFTDKICEKYSIPSGMEGIPIESWIRIVYPKDQKKLEELPGIVCYVVQPRDTLWDIAKMFYTTMEAIRKLNDLGEGEVKPRQTLLVVKNSGCN